MISKAQVQLVRSLTQKKYRKQHKLFVVEGVKLVNELLKTDNNIHAVFATSHWIESNNSQLSRLSLQAECCTEAELKKISNLKSPNEVVALARFIENKAEAQPDLILLLDNIRDPGNLGTLIRTADWFGIETIYCSSTCVDLYNSKVVQASMGSIFRIIVQYTSLVDLVQKYKPKYHVYASVLDGQDIRQVKIQKPAMLIIGNESHGISGNLLGDEIFKITIARTGQAESLNAAVAAGILMEWMGN